VCEKRDDGYNKVTESTHGSVTSPSDQTPTNPLSEGILLGQKPTVPENINDTGTATHDARVEYHNLAGMLVSYGLLTIGNGLLQTLIPLHLLDYGASTFMVGLVQSGYYVGWLLGSIFARPLIDRIGHHRVFIAFSGVAAVLALLFGVSRIPAEQTIVRVFTGFAFMSVYVSIESWINGTVSNERRGQMFGTYATINYLALGIGQLLLNLDDPTGITRFCIVSVLFVAAVIPVSLFDGWPANVARAPLDTMPPHIWRESLRSMVHVTPLAIPGCLICGCLYSSFYAMMPVFLLQSGFTTSKLSSFMSLCLFGALLTQWPVGRLSDRVDRGALVFLGALLSMLLNMALAIWHSYVLVWAATLTYVAIIFTQYGLIVSYINDRIDARLRIAISTLLLVLFSLGGMIGPTIASMFVTIFGSKGLFTFNTLCCALLVIAARRSRRANQQVARG
jgi:MFS family permease